MAEDKKIGLIASTFDLLHAGHVAMIEEAATLCDELWVALQTGVPDRPLKNQPVETVYERWRRVNALRDVSVVIPYESEQDLYNLVTTIPAHVRFLGEEYEDQPSKVTGIELYRDPGSGCDVVFLRRRHNLSSSRLRERVYVEELNRLERLKKLS